MMAGTGPAGGNGIAGASTMGGSSFGSARWAEFLWLHEHGGR